MTYEEMKKTLGEHGFKPNPCNADKRAEFNRAVKIIFADFPTSKEYEFRLRMLEAYFGI